MADINLIHIFENIKNIILAVGVIKIVEFVWRYLNRPNISVQDVELVKYYPTEFDATYVDLKWRVCNNPRLMCYGEYLILMKTMFFVGRGDKGEWHWSGTVRGPQNLPISEKTYQIKNWINKEFPQDTYRIYFIIFSEDKVVHKYASKVTLKEIN